VTEPVITGPWIDRNVEIPASPWRLWTCEDCGGWLIIASQPRCLSGSLMACGAPFDDYETARTAAEAWFAGWTLQHISKETP
jgi:hypothetical protein